MNIKRILLALIAFSCLLPLSGCGCRRNCCNDTRTYAPPAPCCPQPGPPAGYIPPPGP